MGLGSVKATVRQASSLRSPKFLIRQAVDRHSLNSGERQSAIGNRQSAIGNRQSKGPYSFTVSLVRHLTRPRARSSVPTEPYVAGDFTPGLSQHHP